jgi:predicted nucleotidyltransferase
MAVTPAQTAAHLRILAGAARTQGLARADKLLVGCSQAKRVLIEQYGGRRVWLFGSLVAGDPSLESDVDLAVEGLPSAAYFSALAELMTLFHGPVDLVRLEEASVSLRERILSEGREL